MKTTKLRLQSARILLPVLVAILALVTSKATAQCNTSDCDYDGLPDAWEMQYFGTLGYTYGGDYDGEGVGNGQEYYLGTDPTNQDTDGDGLTDYEEWITVILNPLTWDTDGDHMDDDYEYLHFGPSTGGRPSGGDDDDSDGFNNLQEYVLGSNPNSSGSPSGGYSDWYFADLSIEWDENDHASLTWTTHYYNVYYVKVFRSLNGGDWQDVGSGSGSFVDTENFRTWHQYGTVNYQIYAVYSGYQGEEILFGGDSFSGLSW